MERDILRALLPRVGMKCGYYWIVAPLPKRIVEDGSRSPTLELPSRFQSTEYHIALFNCKENRPELIKLTLTGLRTEEIPDDFLPFMQTVKEHMLTTLRLSYDPSIALVNFSVWSFSPDDKHPSISVEFDWNLIPHFNSELARNVFGHSFPSREQFRLFSDGTNEGIPPQYRFLSLYKLIEMQFRRQGKWKNKELTELLSHFAVDFQQIGVKQDPMKEIHFWRDKCAHVRTGKHREILGVSELNHKQLVSLTKILPVVAKVGGKILATLTNGNVLLGI